MSTQTTGQALLAIVESDILVDLGPSLISLLTAVQAAGADPLKIGAAWTAFLGTLPGNLVKLEADLIGAVISGIQAKLQAAITAAQTKPAA